MARISDLPVIADADVDGTETVPVVKAGASRRASMNTLVGGLAQTKAEAAVAAIADEFADDLAEKRDQAIAAAAAAGGYFAFYPTKANATAALAGIPANAFVQVFVDESKGGAHVAYQKTGGALVERVNFSKLLNGDVVSQGTDSGNTAVKAAHDITSGSDASNFAAWLKSQQGAAGCLRLDMKGTGAFIDFHEFRFDAGLGQFVNFGQAHRISGAALESVKFGVITGDVINSHDPYDLSAVTGVNNPQFKRHFIPASARNNLGRLAGQTIATAFANNWGLDFSMWSVMPDGHTAYEGCASEYDFDDDGHPVPAGTGNPSHIFSFRDAVTREEIGGINRYGDLVYGAGGWNSPRAGSGEVQSRANFDIRVGRLAHSIYGLTEGAFGLRHYDVADLVDALDASEVRQGALIWVTDGPTPGPHISFGQRWIPLTLDSANAIYGSGFDWTVLVAQDGGPPTSTYTEEGGRTFTKTAADEAWDLMFYSDETIAGDQKITFEVGHVSNNPLLNVGFLADAPAGALHDDIKHGLYQQNGLFFRLADNAVPFDTYLAGAVVGDQVEISLEAGQVTARLNGGAPLVVKNGAAAVPYRVAVSFNHVGAAIRNLRHVAI